MSLSSSTIAAIQKAGAAVFTVDEMLKLAAKNYADRVNSAMTKNPDSPDNDALIENWKFVARLSQTMTGIEAEIKKVFQSVAELKSNDLPRAATAPKLASKIVATTEVPSGKGKISKKSKGASTIAPAVAAIEPTISDVVIKSKKNGAKTKTDISAPPKSGKTKKVSASAPVTASTDKAPVKPKKVVSAPKDKMITGKPAKVKVNSGALIGNPAKLMSQLERLLNTSDFVEINQSAVAKDAGIAMGSMTAAVKKLIELGRITAGPTGSYKLTPPAVVEVASEAVASE